MKFRDEYFFLSNFYPCEIEYEGIKFPTTEHAYQAAKTLNVYQRYLISELETPGEAKRKGKTLTIREDWDKIKLYVMEDILRKKFVQERFKKLLIKTGNIEIIEDNTWYDTFWGCCNGIGQNHLGKLIMKIRSEHLKKGETDG